MKCKNCGARLADNAKVCQNCGASINNEEGYVLLTSDDTMFDIYSEDLNTPPPSKEKKKSSGIIWALSIILTLLIIACGAFYYFTQIYNPTPDKPALSFQTGSGIINDDEKIIYVLLSPDSNIEFIHGVSLYNYDKTDKNAQNIGAVSTNYEYTKSIDSTFRAIFFDTEALSLANGENTFTFEMKFSFYNSDEIYTYEQPIKFSSEISADAADLIFDHSQSDEATTKQAEENTQEQTTAASTAAQDIDFIYDSYWFTEPAENGSELSIAALKFNKDKSYVSTIYFKDGDKSWQITTHNGKYEIKDGYLVVDNGEATESTYYKADSQTKSIYEEENGTKISSLTSRKYNSIKNVEDFFGL